MRLWGISWGLPNPFLPLRSLHPDEAYILYILSQTDPGRLDLDPGNYEQPNFFILATGAWLKAGDLLGCCTIHADARLYAERPGDLAGVYRWARAGAALAGALAILPLFRAGRILYGAAAGLWAAAFAAVLPVLVVNAHYMKADGLMTLGIGGSLAGAAAFLRDGRARQIALSVAAAALAGSCKYYGLVAGIIPLAAVWARGPGIAAGARATLAVMLGGAACFALLNPFLVVHVLGEREGIVFTFRTALDSGTLHLTSVFEGRLPGWLLFWTWHMPHGAGLPFAALLAASLVRAAIRRTPADVLAGVAWLAFYLVAGAVWAQFMRYWVPAAYLGALLAGAWLAAPADGVRGGAWRRAAGGVALACALLHSVAMDRLFAREDPRLAASAWIEANIPEGHPVARLAHPEYGAYAVDRNWDRLFPLPPVVYRGEEGAHLGIAVRHPRLLLDMRVGTLADPGRPRYLVATSYETDDLLRRPGRDPERSAFVARLLAGEGYRVVASFGGDPGLSGWHPFPRRDPPHDWRYAWPEVWVFERIP